MTKEELIGELMKDFDKEKDNSRLHYWVFFKQLCFKYYNLGKED